MIYIHHLLNFYSICSIFFISGINNSGGNMIMTSSQISTMGGMAGGGLVVSSSGALNNKPLTNAAASMFASGGHPQQQQQHGPGVPQGIPNGPMMNRVAAAGLQMQRAPGGGLHIGARLPMGAAGLSGPPGMASNVPYTAYQNAGPQGLPVGE